MLAKAIEPQETTKKRQVEWPVVAGCLLFCLRRSEGPFQPNGHGGDSCLMKVLGTGKYFLGYDCLIALIMP